MEKKEELEEELAGLKNLIRGAVTTYQLKKGLIDSPDQFIREQGVLLEALLDREIILEGLDFDKIRNAVNAIVEDVDEAGKP